MKKFLILLIIPLFSISQPRGSITNINLNDVKNIYNKKDFLKLVLEEGYTKVEETSIYTSYAKGYNHKVGTASSWAFYEKTSNLFTFQFHRNDDYVDDFKRIKNQLLKNCDYNRIAEGVTRANHNNLDIIYYKCPSCYYEIGYYEYEDIGFFEKSP